MPATKKKPVDPAMKDLEAYLWELERCVRTLSREAIYCREYFKKADSRSVRGGLIKMSDRIVVIHEMIRQSILSTHAAFGAHKKTAVK